MENISSETTSQNKYTSPVKLIASLGLFGFLIAFAIYTYASATTLTLEEIENRRTAEMLQAQTKIDMDNLKTLSDCHDIAEREAKYPEQYLSIRETCYQKGKKPDIVGDKVQKLYSWTASGAIVPPPSWNRENGSIASHVKTAINEKENSTLASEKGESDDSQIKPPSIQHQIESNWYNTRSEGTDIRSVLSLDSCRIVQDEESHVTLKGGHVYATDIACIKWQSFTVSSPQWKKEYIVSWVGKDSRLGNYIILKNENYLFVFWHTESPHKVWDIIPAGVQIGYTDKSWLAQNVHLHFELWRDGYNITHHEMIGQGSKWNDAYSFRILTQRGWYTGIDDAIKYITSFEGFLDESYEDPKGSNRWSIGYGTYAAGPGEKITKDEAKKRIRSKVIENMDFIYRNRLAFTWNQRIALSSFFYNLGTARPEMISALKSQDKNLETLWKKYCSPGSIYEKGLKKRRESEWKKFISK